MTEETTTCHVGTCTEPVHPAHDPCCSSHGQPLCCQHYRRFHFVETACGHEPCSCGSREAYSLTPGEWIDHQPDACRIMRAATSGSVIQEPPC